MPPEPRLRDWDGDTPEYVFSGQHTDFFSVAIAHNGFFCGIGADLEYASPSVAIFDYCSTETWSILWIDDFLKQLGYERDGKLVVYWSLPENTFAEGLVRVENDSHIVHMIEASEKHKTLCLTVDHSNFLGVLRADVILTGPPFPPVVTPRKLPRSVVSCGAEASSSSAVVVSEQFAESDDSDTDFKDSDYDAESGDDDLFLDNVDSELNDNNEQQFIEDFENDAALDDDDLQLGDEESLKLLQKFKAFNPAIDMENPTFRVGMVFSDVEELRRALTAYSIKNRVLVRKKKNDLRRLEAVCRPGCTWRMKAYKDSRSGGFIIKLYCGKHTCQRVWEMRALTSSFLTDRFMEEFRDNQKMDLKTFAAKVQRQFNMCPNMLQNFQKAGHRGETLKNDVWAIARSTHLPKWQENMAKLESDSAGALAWIEELVPKTWIKAFFSEFPKCDMLLNNHSEVFNSYIIEAREMPILSMLETIFYKLVQRIEGKQRESEKWEGRICPKIKKKLDKFTEWSAGYFVLPAGNQLFRVGTGDMEKSYVVDFKTKSCDCKRWQLNGIPCHHVIACCRTDNIDPETLVHSCYSVETFKQAYSHNLIPLRGRSHWEKTNGSKVHPPLYTKVMGRPKKNRKKAPEEKEKNGATVLTKHGVTIHCGACGEPGHNKKGHDNYVLRKQQQQQHDEGAVILEEDEEFDDPSIIQHLFPQNTNPSLDPTHQVDSMIYRMGREDRAQVPVQTTLGPLPESEFVVAARESIPQTAIRATTATTRGKASMRSRGRGRTTARQAPVAPQAAARGNHIGNKRTSKGTHTGPEASASAHGPLINSNSH